MDAVTAVLLGILIGLATGMVPGLHVNLLAALLLLVPGIGAEAALGIVAVGVVHTFVAILPTTYLGAPGEDTALAVLPAHRLLQDGMGPDGVRWSLHASLLAALGSVALLPLLWWAVSRPGALDALRTMAPLVLVAVPLWLAARDRWPAWPVVAIAAVLGHIAWDWPVHGIVRGAATPLLPLLSGLFGVPTLLWAMRQAHAMPWQMPPSGTVPLGMHRASLRGLLAAGFTALLPGLTAAVATSIAQPRRTEPARVLATLSAVNTGHLIIALGALWLTGRTRSGLAIAWSSLRDPLPWTGWPPPDLLAVATTILAASGLAVLGTIALEPAYRTMVQRGPARVPEGTALAIIIVLVAATTGWLGLLLLLVASLVGMVPLAYGVRRVHLAACLSIPIALRLTT